MSVAGRTEVRSGDVVGRATIKGPGFRLGIDVRRVWKCPQCDRVKRTTGHVTAVRCHRSKCGHAWMRLIDPPGREPTGLQIDLAARAAALAAEEPKARIDADQAIASASVLPTNETSGPRSEAERDTVDSGIAVSEPAPEVTEAENVVRHPADEESTASSTDAPSSGTASVTESVTDSAGDRPEEGDGERPPRKRRRRGRRRGRRRKPASGNSGTGPSSTESGGGSAKGPSGDAG